MEENDHHPGDPEKRQTIAPELYKKLNLFMSSNDMTVANMKQSGEISASEGKLVLSFDRYEL